MRRRHRLLIVAILVMVLLVILGTSFFMYSEGWSLVDAIYFTGMTITTVGYGDIVPTHDSSKMVATAYAVVSIPIAIFAFGILAENYFEVRLARLERRMQEMMQKEKEIKEAVEDNHKKETIN